MCSLTLILFIHPHKGADRFVRVASQSVDAKHIYRGGRAPLVVVMGAV